MLLGLGLLSSGNHTYFVPNYLLLVEYHMAVLRLCFGPSHGLLPVRRVPTGIWPARYYLEIASK